jgi:hypothetical protein
MAACSSLQLRDLSNLPSGQSFIDQFFILGHAALQFLNASLIHAIDCAGWFILIISILWFAFTVVLFTSFLYLLSLDN